MRTVTLVTILTLLVAAAAYAHTAFMPREEAEKCFDSIETRLDSMDNTLRLILEQLMQE